MQGTSGSYAYNGTTFTQMPTSGKWLGRDNYGVDGNGHPVYAPVREFEIKWNLISVDDLRQIILLYDSVSNTGTVVMDLPEWRGTEWKFRSYSGTTLTEPQVGEYFNTYVTDVVLVVKNVRT